MRRSTEAIVFCKFFECTVLYSYLVPDLLTLSVWLKQAGFSKWDVENVFGGVNSNQALVQKVMCNLLIGLLLDFAPFGKTVWQTGTLDALELLFAPMA